MNRRVLNPLLLVLAFVLGSYAVWQWRQRQVPPPEPPLRSDYVLRDYELITLNEAGEEAFVALTPQEAAQAGVSGVAEPARGGAAQKLRGPVAGAPGGQGAGDAPVGGLTGA